MNVNIHVVRAVDCSLLPDNLCNYALPEGTHYLVQESDQTLMVIPAVLHFITSKFCPVSRRTRATGQARLMRAPNTINAVVRDLKDYWEFLLHIGKHWNEVSLQDICDYRDSMTFSVSPSTHQRYSRATVRRRLSSILSFYQWADRERLTDLKTDDQKIEVANRRTDSNMLAHLSTPAIHRSTLLPRGTHADRDLIKAMTPEEYRRIALALGPLPSEDLNIKYPCRDRLAAELSLQTGMRIDEVCNLTTWDILNFAPDEKRPTAYQALRITHTKGSKPRDVWIPNWMISELQIYIRNERLEALLAGRKCGLVKDPIYLFLNSCKAKANAGRRYKADSLDDSFRKAVIKTGLVEKIEKLDPGSGAIYSASRPRYTFHCLRHTFAIWRYYEAKAAGSSESWKLIQTLLGHASEETTKNIYLRPSLSFEAIVSDRIEEDFSRIRDGK